MTGVSTPPASVAAGRFERADGVPKVRGEFTFAGDLDAEGALWGATLRSPHARARVVRLDLTAARALPGVLAVVSQADVPGDPGYGLIVSDQPVFCQETVEYYGQPVAALAAVDPATARRALRLIEVEYEPLQPLVDSEEAIRTGSVFDTIHVRRGDPDRHGAVCVEGSYELGQQDQAALATESGIAIPDADGGVDLLVATQWIHDDLRQISACLALPPEMIRIHPAGVGGAFGAREDLSIQIHLAMLALKTGRPVRMILGRDESFVAHPHRHPAHLWYRHEADADGTIVRIEARIVVDGGAYTGTSPAVAAQACLLGTGPYRAAVVAIEGHAARTNNPPAGAMRGFGAVQAAFAVEAQMDRLADALGIGRVDLRRRNALAQGDLLSTDGQVIEDPLPLAQCLDEMARMPLPSDDPADPWQAPGGSGCTTERRNVRRGVGIAVGLLGIAYPGGLDDYADARVTLSPTGAVVHSAAVEVGQGLGTTLREIVREAMGVQNVEIVWATTSQIGSAGSSSASRQTMLSGGAALAAATELRSALLEHYAADSLDDAGLWRDGRLVRSLADACSDRHWSITNRFRHPPTVMVDAAGQGDFFAGLSVSVHRAVVDVDVDLGLVHVVQVDVVQDVGRVINPPGLLGQVEGGVAQGIGLATMEEIVTDGGIIRNGSFTDYLIPTFEDAPRVNVRFVEIPSRWGPYGAKGAAEAPTIASPPAVAAAIRAATGAPIDRIPARPQDVVTALHP